MSDDSEFNLTFLPFYVLGFKDDLTLSLDIKGREGVLETLDFEKMPLRGPEHVVGINKTMIARVYPIEGANDAETNYFPYIEFVDPDFPWRYSKKENTDDDYGSNQLFPWLCLVVLKTEEIINIDRTGKEGREVLTVIQSNLPDLESSWATAHIQLNGFTGTLEEKKDEKSDLEIFLDNYPAGHCSRLFCFRYLEPETHYHAFLVPTFEKSLIPYYLSSEDVDAMGIKTMAWDETSDDPVSLPIYYRWSFMTAEKGDFEELIRKLKPGPENMERVGSTVVASSEKDEKGILKDHYFKREGALATLEFCEGSARKSYLDGFKKLKYPKIDQLIEYLNDSLSINKISTQQVLDDIVVKDGEEDPLVTYPVYGRYYRQVTEITDEKIWPVRIPWIHELNLDLRYRLAASFGTTAVQNQQDDYMEECWSQVGDLNKANQRIRLTKAGLGVSNRIFKKHLDPSTGKLSQEQFAFISAPFHSHFSVNKSEGNINIKQALKNSGISPGIFSGTLKKIASKKVGSKIIHNPAKLLTPWKEALNNEKSIVRMNQDKKRIKGRITNSKGQGIKDLVIKVYPLEEYENKISEGRPSLLNTKFKKKKGPKTSKKSKTTTLKESKITKTSKVTTLQDFKVNKTSKTTLTSKDSETESPKQAKSDKENSKSSISKRKGVVKK